MHTSKKINSNINFLKFLSTCNVKQRKAILKLATKDEILSLTEVCINLLGGNIELTLSERKRLKKHSKTIRGVSGKIPFTQKKKLLVQRGGFLPLLLAPLLSVLASVTGAAISRAI